jgi:hypothetical protein
VLQIHIRVHLCYIVGKQHRMGATIENFCDWSEWFLTGCIPHL